MVILCKLHVHSGVASNVILSRLVKYEDENSSQIHVVSLALVVKMCIVKCAVPQLRSGDCCPSMGAQLRNFVTLSSQEWLLSEA